MRVLIVKTSSMGDIIHTLPALTDAGLAIPGITFDWVIENNFAEIPAWHNLVETVIPLAWRKWRKQIFTKETRQAWRTFRCLLQSKKYDVIIDAQGLVKSAFITRFANGKRCGLNWQSAREPLATLFYDQRFFVPRDQHAIWRTRNLFSQALGYTLPTSIPEYGITREKFVADVEEAYLLFLHGTTWPTKHWSEANWIELVKLANAAGYKVKLAWGSQAELERAQRIQKNHHVEVLPRLDLKNLAGQLAGARAAVAVDTGLGHLAAALNVPTVSLYGPTNPKLVGALGKSQIHLVAPAERAKPPSADQSIQGITSSRVWEELITLL